jgi:hypothetical protein
MGACARATVTKGLDNYVSLTIRSLGLDRRSGDSFGGNMSITRRGFIIGLPLFAAGCATSGADSFMTAYGPRREERFPLGALSPNEVKPELRRQVVDYETRHPKGTDRRRYAGKAPLLRSGRRQGDALRRRRRPCRPGAARQCLCRPQGRMAELDPDRQHDGARSDQPAICRRQARRHQQPARRRALYLYRDGRDTMFRIHGTNQPQSIGHAMSSGCIRMLNHDVIDLSRARADRRPRRRHAGLIPRHPSPDKNAADSLPRASSADRLRPAQTSSIQPMPARAAAASTRKRLSFSTISAIAAARRSCRRRVEARRVRHEYAQRSGLRLAQGGRTARAGRTRARDWR